MMELLTAYAAVYTAAWHLLLAAVAWWTPLRTALLIALVVTLAIDCRTTWICIHTPGDFETTRIWVILQARYPRAWPLLFLGAGWGFAAACWVWPILMPLGLVLLWIELRCDIGNIRLLLRTNPGALP